MESSRVAELVRAAVDGDQAAWERLVSQFAGLVWSVARAHGLSECDAADVTQTTWLRLAEHLDRIREPERVGGWLATTARNESLRVLRQGHRSVPSGVELGDDADPTQAPPERALLRHERNVTLWRAFEALPTLCRSLLRVLISDPAPSYADVSAALDMPVGSIGPRRARCLDRLRGAIMNDTRDGREVPGASGARSGQLTGGRR